MTKRSNDPVSGNEPRWRGVEPPEGPATLPEGPALIPPGGPRPLGESRPRDGSRSSGHARPFGGWVIAGLVIVLLVLHQDSWFWEDGRLVWGIFPVGLFWHICLSIAATLTWALATKIAWPLDDPETPEEAR